MESELSNDEVVSILAKLILQKFALMQVQDKIDSLPKCDDFLIYDKNVSDYATEKPLILNVLVHDLAKGLGHHFAKQNLSRVLDSLMEDGLITYREYEESVYYVNREMSIKRRFLLLEIAGGLIRANGDTQEQKLKNGINFQLDKITDELKPKTVEKNDYAVELILDVNEKFGNGSLRVHFTQSDYNKEIKRFNSLYEKKPNSLIIAQWLLGKGYKNGSPVRITKAKEKLNYTKTGSGIAAEIFPNNYKILRELFVSKSGKDYLGIKKGLTVKELELAGYDTGQLQKILLSK